MQSKLENPPIKVGMISLGCAKNLVDAEIMLGSLVASGMELTNDPDSADVVIVNTCSFIDSAQEESIDAILESNQIREATHPEQGLIVSGCLPQRFRDKLPQLLPEVDAFIGIDQVRQIGDIVEQVVKRRRPAAPSTPSPGAPQRTLGRTQRKHATTHVDGQSAHGSGAILEVNRRPAFIPDFATPRFRLTPRHSAYVKIAEGCNHPCSFCTIPQMRGSHRSRAQADVVEEAKRLISDGVKELNLISQDSTYYGLDLRPNHRRSISSPERFAQAAGALAPGATTLCTLLRELNALPGEFWIRLLYTHPAHWTDELIRTIAECPKVARYVDIPLQHIHGNMLERMRRETTREYIVDLIERIRAGIPDIALRTTFIVGFPGETEGYFQSLLDFIRATRFERLGIFSYSMEEDTRAGRMAGQLPQRIKEQRRDAAMAAQLEVSRSISRSFLGRSLKVLVEKDASLPELERAQIVSWEHGFTRDKQSARSGRTAFVPGGEFLLARGEADAPDIDGRVYVRGPARASDFAWVRIIGHTDYDLIAEPAPPP